MPSIRPRSNTTSVVAPSGHETRSRSMSLMSRSLESFKLGTRRRTPTWTSSNGDPTDVDEVEGRMARQLLCANPKFASSSSSRSSRASRGSGVEVVRPVKSVSKLRRNTLAAGGGREVGRNRSRHDEASPKQVPEKLLEQSERELNKAMKRAQMKVEEGKLDGAVVEELSQVLQICKARGLMRHDCEVFDDACTMKSKLRAKLKNKLRTQPTTSS